MDENTKEIDLSAINGGDDPFVIGEGFEVNQNADLKKSSAKKNKHKKAVMSAVIRIIVIFLVSVILAGGIIFVAADYLGIGPNRGAEVHIEIEKGTPTKEIAAILKDVNAINNPFLFRVYSKLKRYDARYQYGVYVFNNELGYDDIADMLLTEGARPESKKVTITESMSIDEIADKLGEEGICTPSDFKKAIDSESYKYDFLEDIPSTEVYYRLEGYLFPDTYDFYCYDSAECSVLAVDKMLSRMNDVLNDGIKEKLKSSKYTLHQILTMASIVELEASGEPEEMKNVAQVFYTRLEEWDVPLLGSTPTARYKHGGDRYNTNVTKGLPPGPLCSPSKAAILAAIEPNTECKATYFVTDAHKKFYYTYSLEEHNKLIRKLKAENNWIYETY